MKLTLQILDAGETFYRPLEDRTLSIGCAAGADVRLTESDVADRHARVEPLPGGGYRLVDLGSEIGTRVNGEDVVQARLEVGDRVEIGRAVLVVGQRVERRRTAADVVDEGQALAASAARRRRLREPAPRSRRGLWIGAAVAVVAAALIGGFVLGGERDALPSRWGDLQRACRDGRVADARHLVERFRTDWAAGHAERQALLDESAARIAAIESAIAAVRERVVAESTSLSYAEQIDALKNQMRGDPDDPGAIAARLALSRIEDLRREGGRLAAAARDTGESAGGESASGTADGDAARTGVPAGAAAGVPGAASSSGDDGDVGDATAGAAAAAGEFVAEQLRRIREARDAGRFNEALETLQLALSATAADHAAPLREARVSVENAMRQELDELIDTARQRASGGTVADVEAAIELLDQKRARFPAEGPFARIPDELADLSGYRERLLDRTTAGGDTGGGDRTEPLSYTEVATRLEQARRADAQGRWDEAIALFRGVADRLRDDDPAFAADLDGRRQDLEFLAAFDAWRADGPLAGPLDALAPEQLAAALRAGGVPAEVRVGAAVFAYRTDARDTAEDLLARALRDDADLKQAIDGVIARGRGESLDALGYRLVDGDFVAERELRVLERARELERELTGMLRQTPERRAERIEEILSAGPAELDALIVAMRRRAEHYAQEVVEDPFHDHYDELGAVRSELDAARRAARELIFDEQRYFYPYRAPAVSGAKESEYWKVQSEVDRLVAAVRAIWQGDHPRRKVSRSLLRNLERVDWLLEQLRGFGETMPTIEHDVLWARLVPADEPLGLHEFCWDEEEKRALAHARAVDRVNAAMESELTRAEARQVEITNAYRTMFGHRPLAVDARLIESARGHAEEMARLGYFSHFSPTPGRKSPFERMKLAGYPSGASENIAAHPSAESAHQAWTRSSGHHRNLLAPGNTEFAVGNDGRYWVQNFGRGTGYRDHPAYDADGR